MDAPGFGPAAAEHRQQAHPGAPTRMRRGWRREPPRTLPITTPNICVRGTEQLQGSFYPNWIFCMFPLRTPHACLLREPQQYFLSCVSPHTAAVF